MIISWSKWNFYLQIQYLESKLRNVLTVNNEGNLFTHPDILKVLKNVVNIVVALLLCCQIQLIYLIL